MKFKVGDVVMFGFDWVTVYGTVVRIDTEDEELPYQVRSFNGVDFIWCAEEDLSLKTKKEENEVGYKIGDLVLTTVYDRAGAIVHMHGGKGVLKPYLVDFGQGFDGHNGGYFADNHYLHPTNTCWWCAEEEITQKMMITKGVNLNYGVQNKDEEESIPYFSLPKFITLVNTFDEIVIINTDKIILVEKGRYNGEDVYEIYLEHDQFLRVEPTPSNKEKIEALLRKE